MPKYVFSGVAFVSGVKIIVEARTLSDAVGIAARQESVEIETDAGQTEYFWTDLNSGAEESA